MERLKLHELLQMTFWISNAHAELAKDEEVGHLKEDERVGFQSVASNNFARFSSPEKIAYIDGAAEYYLQNGEQRYLVGGMWIEGSGSKDIELIIAYYNGDLMEQVLQICESDFEIEKDRIYLMGGDLSSPIEISCTHKQALRNFEKVIREIYSYDDEEEENKEVE